MLTPFLNSGREQFTALLKFFMSKRGRLLYDWWDASGRIDGLGSETENRLHVYLP